MIPSHMVDIVKCPSKLSDLDRSIDVPIHNQLVPASMFHLDHALNIGIFASAGVFSYEGVSNVPLPR